MKWLVPQNSRFDNLFLFLQYLEFMGRPSSCEFPRPEIALQNRLDSLLVCQKALSQYPYRKEWFVVEVLGHGIGEVENGSSVF
jgi:hypothetical protein